VAWCPKQGPDQIVWLNSLDQILNDGAREGFLLERFGLVFADQAIGG
jgi:hypothetical protein